MTPSEEALRRRLEALNRGALPEPTTAVRAKVEKRVNASTRRLAAPTLRLSSAPPLVGLLRRAEVVETDAGPHAVVRLPLDEAWPGGEELVHKRMAYLRSLPPQDSAAERNGVAGEADAAFVQSFPERIALFDLETCGLAGSAVFLAGLLRMVDGRLVIELLLARNYAEEPAMMTSLWQRMEGVEALATFNGKSFDWPMTLDRWRRHLLSRGRRPPAPRHWDVLHAARRRWRGELPDCRLQTLEQRICGRRRDDDVEGSRIGAEYQQFVRTGFPREMDRILRHNALDLATLLDLAVRLADEGE
jgi:uncharacterized protein YprB with RNaseH-like and TPR domain